MIDVAEDGRSGKIELTYTSHSAINIRWKIYHIFEAWVMSVRDFPNLYGRELGIYLPAAGMYIKINISTSTKVKPSLIYEVDITLECGWNPDIVSTLGFQPHRSTLVDRRLNLCWYEIEMRLKSRHCINFRISTKFSKVQVRKYLFILEIQFMKIKTHSIYMTWD